MGTGPKDGLDPSKVLPSSCFMGGVGTCFLVFKLNKSFDPMDGARDSVRLTPGEGCAVCFQALLLPTAPSAGDMEGASAAAALALPPEATGRGSCRGNHSSPGLISKQRNEVW